MKLYLNLLIINDTLFVVNTYKVPYQKTFVELSQVSRIELLVPLLIAKGAYIM